MLFRNITLVLPDGLDPDRQLRTSGGLVTEMASSRRSLIPQRGEKVIDGQGGYLAPGFVDLHVHGACQRDAMEATGEAFDAISRFHVSGGTVALALTSVAAPHAASLRLLRAVEARLAKPAPWPPAGARVVGVHLEGPYLAPGRVGAHDPGCIHSPRLAEAEELLAYAPVIAQMTLAPELPRALEVIAMLRARGVNASGGHSDAWEEEAEAAFGRGMNQVTHLFNAMSAARRRGVYRAGGLVEFALGEPGIRCELIADGHHVSPALLRMAYRAKGADGLCLITDASPGAGLPEGAAYRLGTLDCVVRGGVGLTSNGAALAGSTATMIGCVRNMVRLAGVPLDQAVRMASWNPARALGLDTRGQGRIAVGGPADLVLLSPALEVLATYMAGERVFPEPAAP